MSTQTTLGQKANDRTEANGKLGKILEKDDAIDALEDIQVIDAWVRGQFAHQILKGKGPRYMHTDDWDAIEKQLKDAEGSALKEIAIRTTGRNSSLSQALGWENGPGNPRTLFNRWTKDDADNPLDVAREHLKSGLRGSGMARIQIYRSRVRYHSNNPDELQEFDQ